MGGSEMTNSGLRSVMRRLAVSALLVAATLILRTSTVQAGWQFGPCSYNQNGWGCDWSQMGFPFCFDAGTCLDEPPGTQQYCYCQGEFNCNWEPAC